MESKQNFLELGSVLSSFMGLSAMLVGGSLAHSYGLIVAIKSIIVGNLLLWAIGLGILAMTEGKNNTIENVKEYLGKPAAILNSFIIIGAFIFWYSIQIDGPAQAFTYLLNRTISGDDDLLIKIGAILGFLCSLLSLWGISFIKWISVIGLPLMLAYQIYAISTLGIPKNIMSGELSLTAVSTVLLSWLPATINLSTFSRHARSKSDAFLALSITTITHIVFQVFTALILVSNPLQIFLAKNTETSFYTIFTCIFIFWAFICANLSNIYCASAGWDVVLPHRFNSIKKYTIIGMAGTLTYTFLQKAHYMSYLERAASNSIACLAITFLVSFLLKIVVKHRPRRAEKFINSLCWFYGWIASIYTQITSPTEPNKSLIIGTSSTIILYLIIIFLEESAWSINQVNANKNKKK